MIWNTRSFCSSTGPYDSYSYVAAEATRGSVQLFNQDEGVYWVSFVSTELLGPTRQSYVEYNTRELVALALPPE